MFLCKDCIENELTIGFLVDYLQIYIIDIDSIYNSDLRDSITKSKDRGGGRVMHSRFPCCVLLALSWNTNANSSTDKLSRAIN